MKNYILLIISFLLIFKSIYSQNNLKKNEESNTKLEYIFSKSDSLASLHFDNNQYDSAIYYYSIYLKYSKKIYGNKSDEYCVTLSNLANSYFLSENFKKAIKINSKNLKIQKKKIW